MTREIKSSTAILFILLSAVLVGAGAYLYSTKVGDDMDSGTFFSIGKKSASPSPTTSATTATTTSTSPTTSASASTATTTTKTYTNTQFGFTLTFPASWSKYKVSPLISGKYLYFGLPTTEDSAIDSELGAGYGSMFAVGVYTIADWNAYQAEEGAKSAELTRNATYVFDYSPSQASPTDLMDERADVAAIIATLKLIN